MAFNLYKLLTGKDNPADTKGGAQDWYKALGIGWRQAFLLIAVVLLLAGAYTVYRFFFPKPLGNNSVQRAVVLPFAKVEKIDQHSDQTVVQPPRRFHIGGAVGGSKFGTLSSSDRDSVSAYIFGWIDF